MKILPFTSALLACGLVQCLYGDAPLSTQALPPQTKSSTLRSKSSSYTISSRVASSQDNSHVSGRSTVLPTKTSFITKATTSSGTTETCTNLLIDDWASQSRLTFLFYNAMLQPSSDDGTMKPVSGRQDTATSVIVLDNHVTLSPVDSSSYFYTQFNCLTATGIYNGIELTIQAPAGTSITVELQTSKSCDDSNLTSIDVTSKDLGWIFDGKENVYAIPFEKFAGVDTDHLITLLFTGLSKAITLGPMAFYCNKATKYPIPSTPAVIEPTSIIPSTTGPSSYVIDTFNKKDTNNLGFYHGGDDSSHMKISSGKLTVNTNGDSDLAWYTQITASNHCLDLTPTQNSYLHISYSGSSAFSIALQQHNPTCNDSLAPFPLTWDSVEASRYSNSAKSEIFIPLTHFHINFHLTIGFALKGFYTSTSTTIFKIELTKTVPDGFLVPSKLDTAPLIFACTRPNSFAFAIDDGDPAMAQQVIQTLKKAGITATFFTVGAALIDTSNNLTNVYKEMASLGHQIAYHSYTHPPMEGLPSLAAIDWELDNDVAAVEKTLGLKSTYFRPPFGTEGARVRQRLAARIKGSKFVGWSVDVGDWEWAMTDTPEKQLVQFQNDVDAGGNLVVCHYLYQSTVDYLPQFIEIAKKTGKQIMRLDQCLEDPEAPPL